MRELAAGADVEASTVGIALNIVALAVMLPVAVAQWRTGRALRNDVLVAQSKETWLSNALSVNVLVGLGLNAALGWAWADPVVALVVAGFAAYAGGDAWREAAKETQDRFMRARAPRPATTTGRAGRTQWTTRCRRR